VNPSDYGAWLTPQRGSDTNTATPIGNEGSGIVVAGNGLYASRQIGKKVGVVAVGGGGTYAEYVAVDATKGAWPMPDDLAIEDAASFFVNPYTAVGIVDTVKEYCKFHGKKASFIHTAAASQLGQMIIKLVGDDPEITLVNIVRREDQKKILTELGAAHVIVTDDKDWKEQLKNKIKQLDITVAFDAVAGDNTGLLLSMLPNKGHCFVYGGLSGKPVAGINPLDLIYRSKHLHGFLLNRWISEGGAPSATTNTVSLLMRTRAASAKVNPGLKHGGWASSTFTNIALEDVHKEFLDTKENGATGKKLRIMFPTTAE
ncbi:hypothetical protein SARC_07218, partial [Sphaeroforma arctica JP610]